MSNDAHQKNRISMSPLKAYLSRYSRDRRITIRMVGELVGIIEPEIPMKTIIRVVSSVLYVIWYLVYIEKRMVCLPNIGKFYAVWRPSREVTAPSITGERIKTISRSKWRFVFKTRLMDKDKYYKFIDDHKQTAKDHLGIEHPETSEEISHKFYNKYKAEHGEVVWEDYIKEWLPYKNQRRTEDLLKLREDLDESCSIYLDRPPDDILSST